MLMVTGGAGFIGTNFVHQWCKVEKEPVVVLDALTYAGKRNSLDPLVRAGAVTFIHGDIRDAMLVDALFTEYRPTAIVHFAAESHVDRSITGPQAFLDTNVYGTYVLLEAARKYLKEQDHKIQKAFRFLHVSTDEVYGSLDRGSPAFTEQHAYAPNSPYSASKASSDHLVRAWANTYGVPAITTHCSNNYGPFQHSEKLIPHVISCALQGCAVPIYGDGSNVRDWIYVDDHCEALKAVLRQGSIGEVYNIGGDAETDNLQMATRICSILDERIPDNRGSYTRLLRFVADRQGHDWRYAINSAKVQGELGWRPKETLDSGLTKTIDWYLNNLSHLESSDDTPPNCSPPISPWKDASHES